MKIRDPKLIGKIVKDPEILSGKPIIAGSRISVELLLNRIASGETYDEIILDYPHLTKKDISAAVEFASELVKAVPHEISH